MPVIGRSLLLLTLSASFGCGAAAAPARPAPTATPAPQQPAVSDELAALRDSIERIPTAAAEPTHATLVEALTLLAEALRRDQHLAAAQRLEELTLELMRSPPNERTHTDMVREALAATLDGLAVDVPRRPSTTARDFYVAARRTLAALAVDEPLRFQLPLVAGTLRSIANLIATERGVAPLFAPMTDDVAVGYDPVELPRRAAAASDAVRELARAREWVAASAEAARALHAFADILAVSPLELDARAWQSAVNVVRYEALELERMTSLSLDRSDRIKTGLTACLDALGSVRARADHTVARRLLADARDAIDAIDAGTPLGFQRAPVQEAFRSLADAMTALATHRTDSGVTARR